MFINVLYKSLKVDPSQNRVKVFVFQKGRGRKFTIIFLFYLLLSHFCNNKFITDIVLFTMKRSIV